MSIKILGDSCCDLTPALKNLIGIKLVPMTILIGKTINFTDDENLDLKELLSTMKASKDGAGSACSAPEEYAEVMRECDECLVFTLSSKLSGSYNSAAVARDMVLEEYPDKKIYIVDSRSASAGQAKLILMAHNLISAGKTFEEVTAEIENFAANKLHTLFVLESLDNLIKNGRISKAAGVVGSMLNLRPIMCDDGNGEITSREKVRGTANAMIKLVTAISELTAGSAEKSVQLVMAHCNCSERALALKKDILLKCSSIKDVLIVPTGGISTVYANDGGIIVAF